jgi:hypothetical protein
MPATLPARVSERLPNATPFPPQYPGAQSSMSVVSPTRPPTSSVATLPLTTEKHEGSSAVTYVEDEDGLDSTSPPAQKSSLMR